MADERARAAAARFFARGIGSNLREKKCSDARCSADTHCSPSLPQFLTRSADAFWTSPAAGDLRETDRPHGNMDRVAIVAWLQYNGCTLLVGAILLPKIRSDFYHLA